MDSARLREYVEGYDRRRAATLPQREEVAARGRALVPELAATCRRFGASRVRLFGSLATGRLGASPDIDLAVDGLAPDRYFALLAALTRIAVPLDVDLVDMASCPPELRACIEADGIDA